MAATDIQSLHHPSDDLAGYLSPVYACSLAEFGRPRHLPESNGWILERPIPGTEGAVDGLGCYPLFCCSDWQGLAADLKDLQSEFVSLAMVTDPFGSYEPALLESLFTYAKPFKSHYVVDLASSLNDVIKRSHREAVRRALKKVTVRICDRPYDYLEKWVSLFSNLVERHRISGIKAFSPSSFASQLRTPGLVMFEALVGSETVGLDLWYVQGDVAYGHLVAFNELGYRSRASYATKWTLLHYFQDRVRWVDLGGAPGVLDGGKSGLDSFKKGWANTTRMAWFCGAVFNVTEYERLSRARKSSASGYFPAYRSGEFI